MSRICTTLLAIACLGCGDSEKKANPTGKLGIIDPAAEVDTGPAAPDLRYERFPTAVEALERILSRTRPRVVGFGEFHQQQETVGFVSTLERFSDTLLPALAGRTSDLIVEAWVSEGGCGASEAAVVQEVEQISKRPATTETENIALLKRARQLGLQPHILQMSCEDYERVHSGDAGLDYVAMLELVASRLAEKSKAVLAARGAQSTDKLIAVFSGAIHNDVEPSEDFASFAFGAALRDAAAGRYVEVDLYVPEFVLASESAREEPWFPLIERLASPDHAALIERGPDSFIVLFPKGVLAAEPQRKEKVHEP